MAVNRATAAVAALPEPTRCRDARSLLAGLDPPASAAVAEVATIRARLSEARAHELLGEPDAALAIAQKQLVAARAAGYEPVQAEAMYRVGRLLSERSAASDASEGDEMLPFSQRFGRGRASRSADRADLE